MNTMTVIVSTQCYLIAKYSNDAYVHSLLYLILARKNGTGFAALFLRTDFIVGSVAGESLNQQSAVA